MPVPLAFMSVDPLMCGLFVKGTKNVSLQLWESFVFPANSMLECFAFVMNFP